MKVNTYGQSRCMYVVPRKYNFNVTKGSSATISRVPITNMQWFVDIEIILLEIYSVHSMHQVHVIFAVCLYTSFVLCRVLVLSYAYCNLS